MSHANEWKHNNPNTFQDYQVEGQRQKFSPVNGLLTLAYINSMFIFLANLRSIDALSRAFKNIL